MAKISFDKYYTQDSIVTNCINILNNLNLPITETVEPSAGNGAFSLRLKGCIAYDIKPEHPSIIEKDFLQLKLPYKKGRLFIGNPPFGTRNTLSVKFFKHALKMGDFIAFILPVSQYNNNQQLYEFDLISSNILPELEYSGHTLKTVFNVYKRPKTGELNKTKKDYTLNDVTVFEYRRGGTYTKPTKYDFGMCSWGHSLGKEVPFVGKWAQENYIIVNNKQFYDVVMDLMQKTDWKHLYPCIATPKIQTWKIYKYIKEQIPSIS